MGEGGRRKSEKEIDEGCSVAGFGEGERGLEAGMQEASRSEKRPGNGLCPQASRRNTALTVTQNPVGILNHRLEDNRLVLF